MKRLLKLGLLAVAGVVLYRTVCALLEVPEDNFNDRYPYPPDGFEHHPRFRKEPSLDSSGQYDASW